MFWSKLMVENGLHFHCLLLSPIIALWELKAFLFPITYLSTKASEVSLSRHKFSIFYLCQCGNQFQCHLLERKFIFLKMFLLIFRKRVIERNIHEKETSSCTSPTRDGSSSPDMCPDLGMELQSLGSRVDSQPLSHIGQAKIYILQIFYWEKN